MSLLEHPTAQALLADAEVSAADVAGCCLRLDLFLQRYLPRFYRLEQHELARVVLQGKLSKLERKTAEPIAYLADRPRKPVQHFVGAGAWDDEAVMAELRRHVAEVMPDPEAVLVVDPSGFPKKGTGSCGVARQWCGRLGKVARCQDVADSQRGCTGIRQRQRLNTALCLNCDVTELKRARSDCRLWQRLRTGSGQRDPVR